MDTKQKNFAKDEKNESNNLSPSGEIAIKKIIEKSYINYEIHKKKVTTESGSYLGLLYEVSIKGWTAEGRKETNLFVKQVIPTNKNLRIFSVSEIYNKEQFFYRELSNIYKNLQNDGRVPMDNRLNLVRFYDESHVDNVILEDMTKKGFKTCNKMDVITLTFAELSIKELAKFHGLSFVMEKKMHEYYERTIKSIKQSMNYDYFTDFINKSYELSTQKMASEVKTKIDKCLKSLINNFVKSMQGTVTKVKCLCHGDFKMNNVLFKETAGEIIEVVVIDYQFIYYGSPIIDFLCFAFTGTDRKFRKNHLNHLKDLYHDTLRKFLKHFDISVDEVYSRDMFESDFKKCLNYSLIQSIVMYPFLFTSEDETPDFGTEDVNDMGFRVDDRFYDRIHGVFDDFIEWGYL